MRSMHPWPLFPPNLEPPAARSLSLLFILQEMAGSFQLLDRLKRAPRDGEASLLALEVEKLLRFSLETPFPQKGGFLDKLCFYCNILLQASKIDDDSLEMILEELRSSVLRLRAKFFAPKKMSKCTSIDAEVFEQFVEIEKKFLSFFSALVPYLQEARTDENVLIFLIEQKETLNRYLGPRAVEDLLRRFFPSGQLQMRAVICEGFTRRGFSSFFSEKEPLIEEIEWETPCHPPAIS
jgi:hypothetical protein